MELAENSNIVRLNMSKLDIESTIRGLTLSESIVYEGSARYVKEVPESKSAVNMESRTVVPART